MPDFYGTAANYKAYVEARTGTAPAQADAVIEAALLVASEWLDGKYASSFISAPSNSPIRYGVGVYASTYKTGGRDQIREWPRMGFTDRYGYPIPNDQVPREIENATYELTKRHLATPGSLQVDVQPSAFKRVSVDGAVSVEYAGLSAAELQLQIPVIDGILANLLASGSEISGMSGKAVRM